MTRNISPSAGGKRIQVDLAQHAPVFPAPELRAFVDRFLGRSSLFLGLVERNGPPLYVLEQEVLRERSHRFQEVFRQVLPNPGFYFAVKSNNHPAVAATLLQTGMGLDVSSGLELDMALRLGTRDIVFSGPGKTDAELRLATDNAERVVVLMDSFGELERLQNIAGELGKPVRTGVRLTTTPGGLWRKFGIPPGDLALFWEKARNCSHVRLQGLQFHTSWNLTPTAQVEFFRLLGAILCGLPSQARCGIRFIDMGGGYWPSQGEWLQAEGTPAGKLRKELGLEPGAPEEHYRLPGSPIELFARQISDAVRQYIHPAVSCRICLEPGRWLCNDAMHLLLSVVDRKGDDLVITDAGTNTVGWERFETDYFPVINLTRPALEEKRCSILGSLCTPHDIWGYTYWGADLQVGDILLVPTQGAYTYSLRQHFIKPLPRVVTC